MQRRMKNSAGAAIAISAVAAFGAGCALLGAGEPDQVISMSDLPAVVKSQAEKETLGCQILEVEKEMKGGKLIYEITYIQAGTKMEIEYDQDGVRLSKAKE